MNEIEKQPEVKEIEVQEFNSKPIADVKPKKLDALLEENGFTFYHFKTFAIIVLFLMGDGSEMIVLSLLSNKLQEQWQTTDSQKGVLGSSVFIGFFIGAVMAGKISDSKGRRPTFILGAFIFSILSLSSALSINYTSFLLIRAFSGIGIGLSIPSAAVLASEIISNKLRSYVMNLIWIAFPIGEIYAIMIASFVLDWENGWRYLLLFVSLPVCLGFGLTFFIKESPKFNLSKKRSDKAFKVINKILNTGKLNRSVTEEERKSIENEFNDGSTPVKVKYSEFCQVEYRRLILQICFIYFSCSFIFYGLMYIQPQIMKEESSQQEKVMSHQETYGSLVLAALAELPGNFLAGYLANNKLVGRRRALGLGFTMTTVFSLLCYFNPARVAFYAAGLKLFITIPFNTISIYCCESFPTRIRSSALGIAQSSTRIAGIMAPFLSQLIFGWSHTMPFVFYSILAGLSTVCSFLLPFETLGNARDD